MRYVPALDGLRAVAVLSVMAFHADLLPGGFLGVDVFFVLSGFLITSLLLQEWQDTGGVDLSRFYLRRALRLWPAFILLLIVCLPILSVRDAVAAILQVTNWTIMLGLTPQIGPFGHIWSLGIEWQFYLAWPALLISLFNRGTSPRKVVLITVGLVAIPEALRFWFWASGAGWQRAYYGTDVRAGGLLVGAICSLAVTYGSLLVRQSSRLIEWLTAVCGTGAIALSWLLGSGNIPAPAWLRTGATPILSLGVALLIVHAATSPGSWLVKSLSVSPLVFLGRISYGLYLWHLPIWFALLPALRGWPLLPLFCLGLSIVIAGLSYRYVERPILRLQKRQIQARQRIISAHAHSQYPVIWQ